MSPRKKVEPEANEKKEPNRNGLRNQAERIILERHREEYHIEAARIFAEHGLEYTRRATPEEQAAKKEADRKAKAEAKLQKLLEAEPHLREVLAQAAPTHASGDLNIEHEAPTMSTGAVGA